MTSNTMYYYTKVMSELFLDSPFPDTKNTFRGMTTMMDFWRVSTYAMSRGYGFKGQYLNLVKTYLVDNAKFVLFMSISN